MHFLSGRLLIGAAAVLVACAVAFAMTMRSDDRSTDAPVIPPADDTFVTDGQEFRDGSLAVTFAEYRWMTKEETLTRRSFPVKVAQTFTPPRRGLFIASVAPYVDYTLGRTAHLSIYELANPEKPESGQMVGRVTMDFGGAPSGDYYAIPIRPAVATDPDKMYSLVIEVPSKRYEMGIGAVPEQDVYAGGRAYHFTRLETPKGKVLDDRHKWRPTDGDITFKIVYAHASKKKSR